MSYELYKEHRLAPDDNGCWGVLTNPDYEQVGTYPSKASAKRAIDEIQTTKPQTDEESDKIKLMIHKLLKYNPKTPPDGHDYQLTDRLEQAISTYADKQARATLDSLIDDEIKNYEVYGDDAKICVGIKLMADNIREKYDQLIGDK